MSSRLELHPTVRVRVPQTDPDTLFRAHATPHGSHPHQVEVDVAGAWGLIDGLEGGEWGDVPQEHLEANRPAAAVAYTATAMVARFLLWQWGAKR